MTLANTHSKLAAGGDFTIVYMGGSITQAGTMPLNQHMEPWGIGITSPTGSVSAIRARRSAMSMLRLPAPVRNSAYCAWRRTYIPITLTCSLWNMPSTTGAVTACT